MKKMRLSIALLLVVAFFMTFTGCGKDDGVSPDAGNFTLTGGDK